MIFKFSEKIENIEVLVFLSNFISVIDIMLKRKANDVIQSYENKEQKQNDALSLLCLKANLTTDEGLSLINQYALHYHLTVYYDNAQLREDFDQMLNDHYNKFKAKYGLILRNLSKEKFIAELEKNKSYDPHIYDMYTLDEIIDNILNDLSIIENSCITMCNETSRTILLEYTRNNFDEISTVNELYKHVEFCL